MKRYTFLNALYIVAGIILFGLGVFEILDSFWSGMGSTLCVIGIIRIVRDYRLNKDEEYREKVEIELTDERNRFIRNKAWAWAGYLYILICASLTIIFRIMNQNVLSMYASGSTCLVLALFWLSYIYLKRKY